MRAIDKLNEAKFFLEHFKKSQNHADNRYFFGAFISAWRSITFVLQKDYRSTKGEKFDDWYSIQTSKLRNIEGAGTFLKLRTILQKEGNKYPQTVFEAKSVEGDEINFTWDLSRGKDGLINFNVKYENGSTIKLNPDESAKEAFLRTMPIMLLNMQKLIEQLSINNILFCIGDEFKSISKERVIDLSQTNLDAVAEVVKEAEKLFNTTCDI